MSLALFVNSSDGFQDCWSPFFKLWQTHGGALRQLPTYLNTERASFQHEGLDIRSTQVWPSTESARPSWSECVLRGLDAVSEKHVLYLQEDYFLKAQVRTEIVNEGLRIAESEPGVGVVYLSPNGPRVENSLPYSQNFEQVIPPAHYLINTQAAIWDKQFLRGLVRNWENAWMFEKFATLRARGTEHKIFALTKDAVMDGEIVYYVWSGVMKGKWKEECIELFREHDIEMDFSRRGFYREGSMMKYRVEVLHKLFGRPIPAVRSIMSLWN